MTPRPRAKIFRTGGSLAVRLPKEFRLPGREVSIRRAGTAVVLEPLRRAIGWSAEFVAFLRSPAVALIERAPQGRSERRDLTLVTSNVREFRRVPDLRVEDWSKD